MQAIHMALGDSWGSHGEPGHKVADLLSRCQRQPDMDFFLVGSHISSQLVSAAVVIKSPGGTGLVFFGVDNQRGPGRPEAAVSCLNGLAALADVKSIKLLEVLVDPNSLYEINILRQSLFTHLTNLIYLTRDVSPQHKSHPCVSQLTWVSYGDDQEKLFCEALKATYTETLDCAELSGLRPIEEVLIDHRATGIFTPSRWWVALTDEGPAGVVLVNKIEFQPAVEIVYIGVAKHARGQGVSDALIGRVIDISRDSGDMLVTLAVDERNYPARRMYDRWGFKQALKRQAWIAT